MDEARAYATAHPAEAAGLLAAEQAGRNRTTLLAYLESLL